MSRPIYAEAKRAHFARAQAFNGLEKALRLFKQTDSKLKDLATLGSEFRRPACSIEKRKSELRLESYDRLRDGRLRETEHLRSLRKRPGAHSLTENSEMRGLQRTQVAVRSNGSCGCLRRLTLFARLNRDRCPASLAVRTQLLLHFALPSLFITKNHKEV